ncbi:MAG: hypothetical protein DWI00_08545 [Planctomycetota bacterium]|nr:MAG: hypothetical protein DWI00_08545 [Planctomycetota bacterium]
MQIFQYKTGKVRSEPMSSGEMAFRRRLVLHRIRFVSGYTAAGRVTEKLSVRCPSAAVSETLKS